MSLRRRAVALVAITNAGLFGVLGALALDDARESEKRERDASVAVAKELTSILGPLLDDALRSSDPSKPGLDLERVLSWPHWSRMKDAILLDANAVRLEAGGAVAVAGLFVNPSASTTAIPTLILATRSARSRRRCAGGSRSRIRAVWQCR